MSIKQVKPKPKPLKRPKEYTKKMGKKVLDMVCGGVMLNEIAEINGMPTPLMVRQWALDNEEFGKQFEKARLMQADCLFEEAVVIGKTSEVVAKDRLRVDTLLKAAAVLSPKKYGDKKEIKDTVDVHIHSTLDLNNGKVIQSGPYVIEGTKTETPDTQGVN